MRGVLVGTGSGLGGGRWRREGVATSQGMLARRPEELGRTAWRERGPAHTWPQPAGEGASAPGCGASLQQPQEVRQEAVPEARQAGPSSSRRVPPQGASLGSLPAPGRLQGVLGGRRRWPEEAAPLRGLSTIS